MRQGGIFNGESAIGAVADELDEYSEAPGTALTVPATITDWDSDADRAAIIAADQAKLDAAKAAASPGSSSFSWAGLTDLQKIGIGVAVLLVGAAIWKGMKPSRSYASNPRKRSTRSRSLAARRAHAARRLPRGYTVEPIVSSIDGRRLWRVRDDRGFVVGVPLPDKKDAIQRARDAASYASNPAKRKRMRRHWTRLSTRDESFVRLFAALDELTKAQEAYKYGRGRRKGTLAEVREATAHAKRAGATASQIRAAKSRRR